MLSAGEVSGDLHGARIARAILSQAPSTVLVGFGGAEMEDAGVRLFANYESYNVMGVLEVLNNLRRPSGRLFLRFHVAYTFLQADVPN